MRTAIRSYVICLAAALSACAADALAQQLPGGALIEELERLEATAHAGGVSLDEAIDRVQRQFGARVVRAEARESKGRTIYVLRLLSEDGRVWTVRVDAQSGRVM